MEVIGYLGPEGSYSFLAARQLRPDARLTAYGSFPLVMASLVRGETDGIVLPIENTLNGGVLQNIDLLQATEGVAAVEQTTVKLDHRLATVRGAEKSCIKRVYSHQQALDQCAKYLFSNFPKARLIATLSTAASLEKLKTEEDAAIVGAHTVKEGIVLSDENVSDESNNFTHFLLVKRGEIPETAISRRVYFSVTCRNVSGALISLLEPLRRHGLSMTKIESRPIKDRPDEYAFFIETEGDYSSLGVKSAIEDIKKAANSFKLLGCY